MLLYIGKKKKHTEKLRKNYVRKKPKEKSLRVIAPFYEVNKKKIFNIQITFKEFPVIYSIFIMFELLVLPRYLCKSIV